MCIRDSSGTVFQDDNGDGVQNFGEGGIAGVEIILTGTDVFGNPVEITTFTDAAGNYTFDNLVAGNYSVTQVQPEGFDDGIDSGDVSFTIVDDMFSNIQLGFGQTFSSNTFAEQLPGGATGNPPTLTGLPRITASQISSLLNSFAGSPGPIYSGIPINGNADPLSLDSGRAVTGGYAVDDSGSQGDCGCPEPINPCCEPVDPCGDLGSDVIIEMPIDEGSFCQPVDQQYYQQGTESVILGTLEVDVRSDEAQPEAVVESEPEEESVLEQPANSKSMSFLKRFENWLNL